MLTNIPGRIVPKTTRTLFAIFTIALLSACSDKSAPGVEEPDVVVPEIESFLTERDLLVAHEDLFDDPVPLGAALGNTENVNLAGGQTAIQSSTGYGGLAGRAVDGFRRGSNYNDGTVTATTNEFQPWWQVDLAQEYQLSNITILNRGDCCAERLSDFYIFVADYDMRDSSLNQLLADANVWSHYHGAAVGANRWLDTATPTAGRFVRIQKAGQGILSLAEVWVSGANLAEGKVATQSTNYSSASVASNAVDGNTNGNFSANSVTSTHEEPNPWWQVDLGGQTSIGRIKLFNRTDCCSSRLSHFYVFVSDSDMSQRSITSLVDDPSVWKSFEVAGVGANYVVAGQSRGRYVRVQLNAPGYLSLAEVVVYGETQAQPSTFKLNPGIYGEWSDVIDWPHIAVHAGLLPNGKILSYDATPDDFKPVLDPVASPNNTTRASLWDIVSGVHTDAANNTGNDMFCSGHTLMADGSYFVAGGTTGYNRAIDATNIFNFTDETWRSGPTLAYKRWYPAVTNLSNGDLIIAGGGGTYPEVYNPETNSLRTLTGVTAGITAYAWPFIMQAPNGRVLIAGGGRADLSFIDTDGVGSLTPSSSSTVNRNRASFVVYDTGKMLVSGGARHKNSVSKIAMNTAEVQSASPMNLPRQDHNSLAMPDGTVMVIGGNQQGSFCGDESASYAPEVWNPVSDSWSLLAAQQMPRQYHSTALLLPDGRIWSGGQGYATVVSTQVALCSYQNNAEIFSPPYLFNSDGTPATRPIISSAPDAIEHLETFELDTPDVDDIASISLIRLSTATHATNFSQRFVPVSFALMDHNTLALEAPADPNVAPPGYYMLFLVNNQGTPSVSKIVKLGSTFVAGLTYSFDFGTANSPVGPGWNAVTHNTNSSLVSWSLSQPLSADRGTVNGGDAINRDFVYFNRESQLNLQVGNGIWRTTIRMGDTGGYTHDNVVVKAEGEVINANVSTGTPQISFIGRDTVSTTPNSFLVEVTDGVLNINIDDTGGQDPNWVLNSIKVERLEDSTLTAPEILPLTLQPQPSGSSTRLSTVASGLGVLYYSWNFGDGTAPTAFAPNRSDVDHQFPGPGRYVVTVTVRDDTGAESSHTQTQIIYSDQTGNKPVASTGIAEHQAHDQLWNVNPDNNSVTVLSTNGFNALAEVEVGQTPVSLAVSPSGNVWVANKGSSTISVIHPVSTQVIKTITLPTGAGAHGLVFDGSNAYVALESLQKIIKINETSGAIVEELSVSHAPRHLTMNNDGTRLYASVFITPPLPNEHTQTPLVQSQGQHHGGIILQLQTSPLQELSDIVLKYNNRPATDDMGPGIPNYVGPVAISPDGTFAWVPSKQDNILNGELRSFENLRFDQTVRAVTSRIDLSTLSENTAVRIDHDNASIASQAAFDGYGTFLFTTLEGNRQIAISDANSNRELLRFDVGRAPQSLVISADNTRLYVHNFMDRTVGIYDIEDLVHGRNLGVSELAVVSTVSSEKLSAEVLQGKALFYDAKDDRLAAFDYMSCASCHNEGGHDGRVWDFTQMGEGLRNTTTLKGRGGNGHGFLHWSANFDEMQDFEMQIREFAGGSGLMSDADLQVGSRVDPLGDSKAGLSADLDALAAYVNSLTTVEETPYRDTANAAGTQQGKTLFASKGCDSCHTGSFFTDSGDASSLHDVGTLKTSSGGRLSAALPGIDTPSLLGAWATAPYLHDGSAATLEAAIAAHTAIATSGSERTALANYVRTLSGTHRDLQNQGTVSGTPVFDSAGIPSVSINSLDDSVVVPHSQEIAVGNGDFSISLWMKLEQGHTGQWRNIFHKGNGSYVRTPGLYMNPHNNGVHYALSTTGNPNIYGYSTREIPLHEWVNIIYVQKDSRVLLYIDGVLDSSINVAHQIVPNTGNFHIGKSPWFQATLGTYAGVNVYHHALEQAEVDDIYRMKPVSPSSANLQSQGTMLGAPTAFDSPFSTTSVAFVGDSDSVVVPHSNDVAIGADDFTVSFWMRLDETSTGNWRAIVQKGAQLTQRTFGIWLVPNQPKLHYIVSTTSNWNNHATSTKELSIGKWTHVAMVVTPERMTLFLDGSYDSSRPVQGTLVPNTGDIHIGASPWYQPIDHATAAMTIYDRALADDEIANLYRWWADSNR